MDYKKNINFHWKKNSMIRIHYSNGTIAKKQFFSKILEQAYKVKGFVKKNSFASEFAKNRKNAYKT